MDTEDAQDYLSADEHPEATAQPSQKNTRGRKPGKVANPCIVCGKNVTTGSVQCTLCTLWCHNKCTGLSSESIRGLEIQASEVGTAYWACRACLSYAAKVNRQFQETNRRQDETDAKVRANSDRIAQIERENENLRQELRNVTTRMDRERERGKG